MNEAIDCEQYDRMEQAITQGCDVMLLCAESLLNMAAKLRAGDAVTKKDISLLCGLHDVCELESERLDKVLETA